MSVCAGELKGHKDSVVCLDSRPNCLASGSEDGTARLWDLTTERTSRCFSAFGGEPVNSVCLGSNDENVFYAASGENVHMFDLRAAGLILKTSTTVLQCSDDVNQIAVHGNGKHLAACDDAGLVKILDIASGNVSKTLRKHTNICTSVAFRPQRPYELFSAGLDCTWIHWDFSRGKPMHVFDMGGLNAAKAPGGQLVNPPMLHCIAASPCGSHVAVGVGNGTVALYESVSSGAAGGSSKKKSWTWTEPTIGELHGSAVTQIYFRECGGEPRLLTASNDGTVAVCTYTRGAPGGAEGPPFSVDAVQRIDHKHKPNWIAGVSAPSECVYVADNRAHISRYTVQ